MNVLLTLCMMCCIYAARPFDLQCALGMNQSDSTCIPISRILTGARSSLRRLAQWYLGDSNAGDVGINSEAVANLRKETRDVGTNTEAPDNVLMEPNTEMPNNGALGHNTDLLENGSIESNIEALDNGTTFNENVEVLTTGQRVLGIDPLPAGPYTLEAMTDRTAVCYTYTFVSTNYLRLDQPAQGLRIGAIMNTDGDILKHVLCYISETRGNYEADILQFLCNPYLEFPVDSFLKNTTFERFDNSITLEYALFTAAADIIQATMPNLRVSFTRRISTNNAVLNLRLTLPRTSWPHQSSEPRTSWPHQSSEPRLSKHTRDVLLRRAQRAELLSGKKIGLQIRKAYPIDSTFTAQPEDVEKLNTLFTSLEAQLPKFRTSTPHLVLDLSKNFNHGKMYSIRVSPDHTVSVHSSMINQMNAKFFNLIRTTCRKFNVLSPLRPFIDMLIETNAVLYKFPNQEDDQPAVLELTRIQDDQPITLEEEKDDYFSLVDAMILESDPHGEKIGSKSRCNAECTGGASSSK